MSKFLYPIYKLNIESYKKWWLYHKKAGGSGVLSEILEGFSFNLVNTLNRKFKLFEIEGNSVQDGSPSPDNEVPIYSAGDNGSINEKIINKNLFDKDKAKNVDYYIEPTTGNKVTQMGCMMSDYIKVSENTNYVRNKKNDSNGNTFFASLIFYDKNKNYISGLWYSDNTFITPVGTRYINLFSTRNRTNNENEEFVQDFMIEQGSTATPFVEHKEQDYSIPVQQPMRSIGDVRDKFVKVNGNWFERHYIGELILNGSESNWYKSSNTTVDRFIYATNQFLQNNLSLCNYFKYSNDSSVKNYWYNNQDIQLCFNFSEPGTTTLEQWKEWLSTHNLTLIQPLETPLDLPCTEEQIQQIENKPSTYKDFTIIQSEDETEAHLKIQYYKEG